MTTAKAYQKQGFIIIKNIISPEETAKLYNYTLQIMEQGNLDDGQVPGSPAFYQDKEVVKLQQRLLPQMEAAIQVQLLPVFCYHRVYRKNAILRMHKDSERAEISASINLGQQGEPWDLWLLDYDENAHSIRLNPGDALLYNGMHLWHWRGKLTHADFVSQIMFHCVNKHGKNTFAAKSEIIRKIRQRCRQFFGIYY